MPELNWMGDVQARRASLKVPYRLLDVVEDVGDSSSGNLLVQGNNLEALRSLLPLYGGRVKCIFIDPPYNTKSAFEHYDDNLEHSQWLSMMYPRLVLLRDLLAEDGSIWVTIDDNEAHYLKVMMDEVFGRRNFVVNVVWQKRIGPDNRVPLGDAHDHILVYGKNRDLFRVIANRIPLTEKQIAEFKNPDNDRRGPWTSSSNFSAQGYRPNQMYEIETPAGIKHRPPRGRCWVTIESEFERLKAEGRMWFGSDGKGMPRKKTYLREHQGRMSWSWWTNDDVGNTQEAKKEVNELFDDDSFDTPKPERLIKRVLEIATNSNDLILDSYLGSGTTAAVAQKMGRRWIGIEMGEHARTHCLPRLKKVVEGEQGGISQAVGWQGGGGFRFATLGASVFDADGRINAAVRFAPLAAFLWREQTHAAHPTGVFDSPLLGLHGDTAVVLLYNGILGDRRPDAGNVLTVAVWDQIRALASHHAGRWLVFGEANRMPPSLLKRHDIAFRQIPYQIGTGQ